LAGITEEDQKIPVRIEGIRTLIITRDFKNKKYGI
jgi:hypothetical protein